MRVVDHMHGKAHSAAKTAEKMESQWRDKSEKHPWISVLKKAAAGVTKTLLEVAVAVYNDSLHETLSAWSWPARSLAAQHEQRGLECREREWLGHRTDTHRAVACSSALPGS